jgi:hypothetical protein
MYWGDLPTAKLRREKTSNSCCDARSRYLHRASIEALDPADYPDQLIFSVNGEEVCQKYFANMVGMADDSGFKNKVWVSEVNRYLGQKKAPVQQSNPPAVQMKREHAYAHILKIVESQMMDMSAHANFENHLYLPYQTITSFYDEYEYLSRRKNVPVFAGRTTFTTAWEKVVHDKKKQNIQIRMSEGGN